MKYIYILHWALVHATGSEPMSQPFGDRAQAISYYNQGIELAKDTSVRQTPFGYGRLNCCTLDSTAVK